MLSECSDAFSLKTKLIMEKEADEWVNSIAEM